jgi:hypothetical protein
MLLYLQLLDYPEKIVRDKTFHHILTHRQTKNLTGTNTLAYFRCDGRKKGL